MNKEITIYIVDRMGVKHELIAPVDFNLNLMELIKSYEFPVEATCGGMALCASCQCYVNSDHQLPEILENEEAMLAEAFNVKKNSRLSCQILINERLDGLNITLAPEE
tara:strand:+ start:802 stop:1125 length:324 start_codon:yes stop_codon:yes gene_type:complete